MNRIRTATLAAGLAVGLAVIMSSCGGDDSTDRPMEGMHGDQGSTDEPNTADLMFVRSMIPHHEQAVEMSDVVLSAPGVSPEMVELAKGIKAAQQPEIDVMQGWLDDWGQADMAHGMNGMGDAEGMHDGMLDEGDMQQLRDASGPRAERLYLQGMIEHHEGAVEMARDELEDGQFGVTLQLAQDIINTQQAEIDVMEDLLR